MHQAVSEVACVCLAECNLCMFGKNLPCVRAVLSRLLSDTFMSRTYNTTSHAAVAMLRVQVHYYEDGNVQLVSQKEVKKSFKDGGSPEGTAAKFFADVATLENDYQVRQQCPERGPGTLLHTPQGMAETRCR